MDIKAALPIFNTLSQETRLRVFRLLVQAGPSGMPAGNLSRELGTPHNTMSFHLNHLSNAGLVSSRKEGRSVIYTANFDAVRSLLAFLIRDCCSRDVANISENRESGTAIIEIKDCC